MDPIRLDVDAKAGLMMDDERSDLMNVDAPTAVGDEVIDSTGLEFITAAEPINGPIEDELALDPMRLIENVLPKAEPP